MKRTRLFAAIFWVVFIGFIALDWTQSAAKNRFDEPPPWQLGQPKVDNNAHCAAPLK